MTTESPFNSHDELAERRSDQGVWNGFMGETANDGAYPADENIGASYRNKPPRTPRPTGKPLEGPSGGDVSRDYANRDAIENPMTPEERQAASRKGASLAREAIKSLGIDTIVRQEKERTEVERDPDYLERIEQAEQRTITARLTKHFGKQQR